MKLQTLATILLAGTLSIQARTWTSSDGSKTFDGDLKSYDPESGKVVLLVNEKEIEFTKDKLSADDITFLDESTKKNPVAPKTEGLVKLLKDGKFVDAKLEKKPDYFLLYYSASW
ncbi:MAG: hypothetical protein AAGC74_00185 [Verrucomicrobiota bacterium]